MNFIDQETKENHGLEKKLYTQEHLLTNLDIPRRTLPFWHEHGQP